MQKGGKRVNTRFLDLGQNFAIVAENPRKKGQYLGAENKLHGQYFLLCSIEFRWAGR